MEKAVVVAGEGSMAVEEAGMPQHCREEGQTLDREDLPYQDHLKRCEHSWMGRYPLGCSGGLYLSTSLD